MSLSRPFYIATGIVICLAGALAWKFFTRSKGDRMREVLSAYNHQPIEFYGQVLDQNKNPIAGAKVRGQIIYNSGYSSGVTHPETLTDSNGLFAIRGYEGSSLGFNILKDGYLYTPEGNGFEFTKLVTETNRHHPDPKFPAILAMWKLQGAEPLIQCGKFVRVTPDGTEIRLDIPSGQIVTEGGDIVVSLRYERQSPDKFLQPYDWKAQITAVNGGFVRVEKRYENMLLAPEEGYSPSLVIDVEADRKDWFKQVTFNCYGKIRGNWFAKLVITINSHARSYTSDITLAWWVNPSGSRNLEYNEKLRIMPQPPVKLLSPLVPGNR